LSVSDDKELIISLYEEDLLSLKEDLNRVENDFTKKLILDEIMYCENRLKEIRSY
jgi:hypothetical protein